LEYRRISAISKAEQLGISRERVGSIGKSLARPHRRLLIKFTC